MSVGLITRFKNERHIMYEWFHHHLKEGVDKFYFIDDHSDDDFLKENSWLLDYVKNGKVKLLKSKSGQHKDYDNFLGMIKKQNKWIIQIDIDEFIFNPYPKMGIKELLNKYLNKYDYIRVKWKLFSHRCAEQPKSVIENNIITHKEKIDPTSRMGIKCIGKTRFLKSIDIHKMSFGRRVKTLELFNSHNKFLQLNHYRTQSDEYLFGVKEQRGDGVGNIIKYKKPNNRHKKFNKVCLLLKNKRRVLIDACNEREQVKPNIYKNSSWFKKMEKRPEKKEETKIQVLSNS